jgi:fido (protein-threonine AMPylation protein)
MPNDDTEQMIKKVELYFKCAAVFMSTSLTLHSFADGNCRMTRLLVNYCLSVINPFPFTLMASREDYVNVICKTRDNIDDLSSDTIEYKNDAVTLIMLIMEQCRPSTLCAMLIRDCWCAWQK